MCLLVSVECRDALEERWVRVEPHRVHPVGLSGMDVREMGERWERDVREM